MKFTTLLASSALVAVSSQAAVLVQYQTAPSTTFSALAPEIVDPALTADNLVAGGGLTANSGGTWNWREWANNGSPDTPDASFDAAVADGDFWTWGFDVTTPLTVVDLTTFDIRVDRSGTGPNEFEIQASVNGGTAVSLLTHDFGDGTTGVDFVGVDLSAIGLLSTGDSVVFTLAAFGADSGGTSNLGTFDLETVDFRGSDERALRIEGDVRIIPEPAALSGLFGIAALLIARRRK